MFTRQSFFISSFLMLAVLFGTILSVQAHENPWYVHIHIRGILINNNGRPVAGARVVWYEREVSNDPLGLNSGRLSGFQRDSAGNIVRVLPPLGGSPIGGLDEDCLQRPPEPGDILTNSQGRYEIQLRIKDDEDCIRTAHSLSRENVRVSLKKEGYSIRRHTGPITPGATAPVPTLE